MRASAVTSVIVKRQTNLKPRGEWAFAWLNVAELTKDEEYDEQSGFLESFLYAVVILPRGAVCANVQLLLKRGFRCRTLSDAT